MYLHGGMSKEVSAVLSLQKSHCSRHLVEMRKIQAFRVSNSMCLTYHSKSQSSRALEMIIQAYWVDCYSARIAAIQLEQPLLPSTEARMTALLEACAVLRLTEKELRNRLPVQILFHLGMMPGYLS